MGVWTHILKCVILVSVWKQTVLLAIKILPSHSHQCCNSYSFHPKCSMCFMSSPCPKYATLSHLWLVFITTVSFQIRSYEFVKVGTQIYAEKIYGYWEFLVLPLPLQVDAYLFVSQSCEWWSCNAEVIKISCMFKFSIVTLIIQVLDWMRKFSCLNAADSIPSLMLFAQSID